MKPYLSLGLGGLLVVRVNTVVHSVAVGDAMTRPARAMLIKTYSLDSIVGWYVYGFCFPCSICELHKDFS